MISIRYVGSDRTHFTAGQMRICAGASRRIKDSSGSMPWSRTTSLMRTPFRTGSFDSHSSRPRPPRRGSGSLHEMKYASSRPRTASSTNGARQENAAMFPDTRKPTATPMSSPEMM